MTLEVVPGGYGGRRYILFCHRFPQLVDVLEPLDLRRIDVFQRTWEMCVAFDRDSQYRLDAGDPPPRIGSWQGLLTLLTWGLGYSPKIGRIARWKAVAPYSKTGVLAQLEKGLKTDDDIIQQWLEGEHVIALVDAATNFDEMIMAFRCIGGDFEDDADARDYLIRVLGPDNEYLRPESDDEAK